MPLIRPHSNAKLSSDQPTEAPVGPLLPDEAGLPDDALDDDAETVLTSAMQPMAPVHEVVDSTVGAAHHGVRLDRVLADWVPNHSRSHLQTLVEQGAVTVDGVLITSASRKLQVGQRVRIEVRPTAQSQAFKPEAMDLCIVFEDEHLLVVNKPAGMVVHPAAGNWQGTLMNGLLAHHAGATDLPRAGIVHRLDKDTSGVMVAAKTDAAHPVDPNDPLPALRTAWSELGQLADALAMSPDLPSLLAAAQATFDPRRIPATASTKVAAMQHQSFTM